MADRNGVNPTRRWGERLPGQYYPGIEGPGNPSWEKRNPLPTRQVPSKPLPTPASSPAPVIRPISPLPPLPVNPGMEKMPKVISDIRSLRPYTPYKGK